MYRWWTALTARTELKGEGADHIHVVFGHIHCEDVSERPEVRCEECLVSNVGMHSRHAQRLGPVVHRHLAQPVCVTVCVCPCVCACMRVYALPCPARPVLPRPPRPAPAAPPHHATPRPAHTAASGWACAAWSWQRPSRGQPSSCSAVRASPVGVMAMLVAVAVVAVAAVVGWCACVLGVACMCHGVPACQPRAWSRR